jgi:hypothetical protein
MSEGLVCDGCGAALLADEDVRYVLRIQGHAAYDPLEITRQDLERDLESEMARLLESLKRRDPQALEDEVHREFQLDLCQACWRRYIRDPLAGIKDSRR